MLSRSSVESLNEAVFGKGFKGIMEQRGAAMFCTLEPFYILFVFENGHQGVKPENVHLGQPLARASRVE